jgi:predicted nucleotidyltransferase
VTFEVRPAQSRLLQGLLDEKVRFVVVGASALLQYLPLPRTTNDIDLAIAANDERINALLRSHTWAPDPRHSRRWISGQEIVDVVPATPELLAAGSIPTDGDRELSLLGFDLALEHTSPVLWHGRQMELATLPVLVVLKMIAWLDRPYERLKDLGDLARVFERGLDDFAPVRWEPPLADLPAEDQCPVFFGQRVRQIVRPAHLAKVEQFLDRMNEGAWAATFAQNGQYLYRDPEAEAKRRLAAFRRGAQWRLVMLPLGFDVD